MRIVGISDTHSFHRKVVVPDGDVFVCAGDITFKGELDVIQDFANWMKELPHKYKVFVGGNHELGIEVGPKRQPAIKMIRDAGAHYLEDDGVEIEGYKWWGSPIQKWFYDWEWNRLPGAAIMKHWNAIPDDTQILVTHGQPYGILDIAPRGYGKFEHVGDEDLLTRIKQLKHLKAYLGGHLHTSGGKTEIHDGVIFANCSICTEQYAPTNQPIVFEV